MPVADIDEENEIDLEDVPTDDAERARSVDGVVPKQVFKSERDIPEAAVTAEAVPVEGNLYGRQAAPGAGYYGEGRDLHPGKEAARPVGSGQGGQTGGENEGEVGDEEVGSAGYAYQGDDVEGGGGVLREQGQVQGPDAFAYDETGDQTVGQPRESRTVSVAKNIAEEALEDDAREALAVETAGASELALWIKKHPTATVVIVCAALLVLLLAIVLIIVLLGEFACNSTVSSVTSWIYGHIGGTDYCSMLPKIT